MMCCAPETLDWAKRTFLFSDIVLTFRGLYQNVNRCAYLNNITTSVSNKPRAFFFHEADRSNWYHSTKKLPEFVAELNYSLGPLLQSLSLRLSFEPAMSADIR